MSVIRPIEKQRYTWKTKPFAHQQTAFDISADAEDFALLCDMGTGKTKIALDTAAHAYQRGRIKLLLVIAPNGVHENWITREVPAHLPDWTDAVAATWYSQPLARQRKAFEEVWSPSKKGLRVIAMNVEAFGATKKAETVASKLLNAFPTMLVVDESTRIKTPGAKCTKVITKLGKHAVMRRILTGTPVTNSPLDLYAQFRFLGEDYLGFSNYYSFKHHFAEWRKDRNYRTGRDYEVLVGYRNMDELLELIDRISLRIRKSDCLDLPEKQYVRRTFALPDDMRKLYQHFRKESIANLQTLQREGTLTANNVLTRMLRLQQITSGFTMASTDGGEYGEGTEQLVELKEPRWNPRLQAYLNVIEEMSGKVITWARFKYDLNLVARELRKRYGDRAVVEYHGSVSKEDRAEAVDRFQDDDECRFFVGQPHAGGYGLTLTAASAVVYYSNDFSLETRLQSEDRAHRIGQTGSVLYVDLECPGTVDSRIVKALRSKKNLADLITRDPPSEWL
jgi:hypothetical protein